MAIKLTGPERIEEQVYNSGDLHITFRYKFTPDDKRYFHEVVIDRIDEDWDMMALSLGELRALILASGMEDVAAQPTKEDTSE